MKVPPFEVDDVVLRWVEFAFGAAQLLVEIGAIVIVLHFSWKFW